MVVLWLLLAPLLGSYVNIPFAHFPREAVLVNREFDQFGMRFVLPSVMDWPGTVIAIDVGGAVIPVLLSLYLLARNRLWVAGTIATACVAAICHAVAYPVAGAGIVIPVFVPPLATGIIGNVISWRDAAALSYVSGTVGAPVASIGGAGIFDGIFMTGIVTYCWPVCSTRRTKVRSAARNDRRLHLQYLQLIAICEYVGYHHV